MTMIDKFVTPDLQYAEATRKIEISAGKRPRPKVYVSLDPDPLAPDATLEGKVVLNPPPAKSATFDDQWGSEGCKIVPQFRGRATAPATGRATVKAIAHGQLQTETFARAFVQGLRQDVWRGGPQLAHLLRTANVALLRNLPFAVPVFDGTCGKILERGGGVEAARFSQNPAVAVECHARCSRALGWERLSVEDFHTHRSHKERRSFAHALEQGPSRRSDASAKANGRLGNPSPAPD
jgi:hypothetical protein